MDNNNLDFLSTFCQLDKLTEGVESKKTSLSNYDTIGVYNSSTDFDEDFYDGENLRFTATIPSLDPTKVHTVEYNGYTIEFTFAEMLVCVDSDTYFLDGDDADPYSYDTIGHVTAVNEAYPYSDTVLSITDPTGNCRANPKLTHEDYRLLKGAYQEYAQKELTQEVLKYYKTNYSDFDDTVYTSAREHMEDYIASIKYNVAETAR